MSNIRLFKVTAETDKTLNSSCFKFHHLRHWTHLSAQAQTFYLQPCQSPDCRFSSLFKNYLLYLHSILALRNAKLCVLTWRFLNSNFFGPSTLVRSLLSCSSRFLSWLAYPLYSNSYLYRKFTRILLFALLRSSLLSFGFLFLYLLFSLLQSPLNPTLTAIPAFRSDFTFTPAFRSDKLTTSPSDKTATENGHGNTPLFKMPPGKRRRTN